MPKIKPSTSPAPAEQIQQAKRADDEAARVKTTCPITRVHFTEKAKPLTITIDGRPLIAEPKDFSTGSFGWGINEKTTIMIDGVAVKVQLGMNMIVVGSKDSSK